MTNRRGYIPSTFYDTCEYSEHRANAIKAIALHLIQYDEFMYMKNRNQFLVNFEAAIYNSVDCCDNNGDEKFIRAYARHACRIISHLDASIDTINWCMPILNNEITIEKFVAMTSDELNPKRAEKIKELLETRKQQTIIYKTSKNHKCIKCNARNTQSQLIQLRSLDEGYNIRLTCMSCQYSWITS